MELPLPQRGWQPPEGLEAQEQLRDNLESLQSHPGWEAVVSFLAHQLATEQRVLEDHRVPDSQVRWSQGRISALRLAQSVPDTMISTTLKAMSAQESQ